MAEIKFTIMQIIKENEETGIRYDNITKDDISSLQDKFYYPIEKTLYKIDVERTEKYIWFSFDFGNSKTRQALVDLTGTDAPENFRVEAKYPNKVIASIKDFIGDLFKERDNNCIDGLSICGTDEKGFDLTFNIETFAKSFTLKVEKEDSGKYDAQKVKNALIDKIEVDNA